MAGTQDCGLIQAVVDRATVHLHFARGPGGRVPLKGFRVPEATTQQALHHVFRQSGEPPLPLAVAIGVTNDY